MAATATSTRRIEQLNHHQVHDLTKRGYGMNDFCVEFNCEESEFEAQIHKLWHHEPDADSMISNIRRNDKRQRRHAKHKQRPIETVEESPQAPEQQSQSLEEDSDKTVENCLSRLSALLRQEESASAEVIRLEKAVQKQLQRNASFRGKLQQELAHLEKLKAQVVSKGEEIRNLVDQTEANNADLIQSKEELEFARLVLEDTRQQIADAQTPWIGISMTGEFHPINNIQPPIDLDDSGYEAIFAQIMSHQAISDLKGAQIITLARLLAVISHNDNKKLRFIFDDEELRNAYHAVTTDM